MLAPNTLDHVVNLTHLAPEKIPDGARRMAELSLFDWIVVARAGAGQPVAKIVGSYVADEGGKAQSTVVGLSTKVPARGAALANGTASHALDYDDTHFAHVGHPSVGVLPAALALGEARDRSARAVLEAFLIGAEVSIRVGLVLGRAHYQRGFHQTATAGAFGATAAAARILGLSAKQTRHAVSLVSTRASGLKSQFGTMGKPYNAGMAAANGVEAAELAERGFISCDDGLGGLQGFIDALGDVANEQDAWAGAPGTFLFEDVKHKLHACCHGLHATLEAFSDLKRKESIGPDSIQKINVRVNPRWLRVCDIKQPRSGLESKFSYAMTAAMTFYGIDTAAERSYDDSFTQDERLKAFWPRVSVAGDDRLSDTAADVAIELTDGRRLEAAHDLSVRMDLEKLQSGLRAKADGLLGAPASRKVWDGIAGLGNSTARDLARLLVF